MSDFSDCHYEGRIQPYFPDATTPIRLLNGGFASAAPLAHRKPYLVLQVDWAEFVGTQFYIDREPSSFESSGQRVPPNSRNKVQDWGSFREELREGQFGYYESTQVTLHDRDGAIRHILNLGAQQKRSVCTVWMCFDEPTCLWVHSEIVFRGHLTAPLAWSEDSETVTLSMESDQTTRAVGKVADRTAFPKVHPEHRDKPLPIVWGCAKRVEAVCVRRPWETRILTMPSSGSLVSGPGIVFPVLDRPSDIGAPVGENVTAYLGNHEITGQFLGDGSDDSPADFRVDSMGFVVANATILYLKPHKRGVLSLARPIVHMSSVRPRNLDIRYLFGQYRLIKVQSGVAINIYEVNFVTAHYPYRDHYMLYLSGDTSVLNPGDRITFYDWTAASALIRPGTLLRERGAAWKYLCNMLPSHGVARVEGYGNVIDETGKAGKGFIPLGKVTNPDLSDASAQRPEMNLDNPAWTSTLHDLEWHGALGHEVTTVEFPAAPHSLYQSLDSDRIWVTMMGTVDADDNPIVNPAKVMYSYLVSEHLLNMRPSLIDHDSFMVDAADGLREFRVGFAQIDLQQGLAYVQEIANQCHCVLHWTGGKLRCILLRNDPASFGGILQQNDLRERSLAFGESPMSELVSVAVGEWQRYWDDISPIEKIILQNPTVEQHVPRKKQTLPLWLYSSRSVATAELQFWLDRWSRVMRTVTLHAGYEAMALRPGDTVRLPLYVDGEGNVLFLFRDGIVRSVETLVGAESGVKVSAEWIAHDLR